MLTAIRSDRRRRRASSTARGQRHRPPAFATTPVGARTSAWLPLRSWPGARLVRPQSRERLRMERSQRVQRSEPAVGSGYREDLGVRERYARHGFVHLRLVRGEVLGRHQPTVVPHPSIDLRCDRATVEGFGTLAGKRPKRPGRPVGREVGFRIGTTRVEGDAVRSECRHRVRVCRKSPKAGRDANVVVQGVSTPVSAIWIAGASTSPGESVPNRRTASARPATKPGVAAALKPARFASPRTFRQPNRELLMPSSNSNASAAIRGAVIVKSMALGAGQPGRSTRRIPPPPIPQAAGSTTPRTNIAVTAASIALPPRRNTARPASVAASLLGHDHSGGRSRSRFADPPHARPGHAHLVDQCGQIAPPLKPRMIRPGSSVRLGLPVRECPT